MSCHFDLQEPAGDILVFLTGQDDIEAAVSSLREDGHALESPIAGMLSYLYLYDIHRLRQTR